MSAQCEMSRSCQEPVTHVGSKGYVYCQNHAAQRRFYGYESTRKMRPWELRLIDAGKPLPRYKPGPEPKERA